MMETRKYSFNTHEECFDHMVYNLPIPNEGGPTFVRCSNLTPEYLREYPRVMAFDFEKILTPKGYFWMLGQSLFKGGGFDLVPDTLQLFDRGDVVCDKSTDNIRVCFRRNSCDIMEKYTEVVEPNLYRVVSVEKLYNRYYYTLTPVIPAGPCGGFSKRHQGKLKLAPIPEYKPSLLDKIKTFLHIK